MEQPVTIEDLESRYSSPEARETIARLVGIIHILTESIISKDYRASTAIGEAIKLTDEGSKVYERLRRKNVPFPEARLLCLLEMFQPELLIDIEETHTEQLVALLDQEISSRKIQFPFIYGRLLYNQYYDLFSDSENTSGLSPVDTRRLLAGLPQGVFQTHDLITGPYGLLKSAEKRAFPPDKAVFAYHCSDLSCSAIHEVHLSTDYDAPINVHRKDIRKILEETDSAASVWTFFLRDIIREFIPTNLEKRSEPLILLMGDALSDKELKRVLEWLLNNAGSETRPAVQSLGLSGPATKITARLDRAQLMQLILVANNSSIFTAVDTLIATGDIEIPPGEVRRPVVNASITFGSYHLQAEANRFGVRMRTTRTNVAPLRAKQLVKQMYLMNDEKDRQELEWQLRHEPADSLEARLEHWLQTQPPRDALRSLVLARRSNVIVATEKLNLVDCMTETDPDILNVVLWKLGYTDHDPFDPHAHFWNLHSEMLALTRQSAVGALGPDPEQIRRVAGSYFVSLEELLDESISYIAWAMTTDHYASDRPFVYRPERDRLPALQQLNEEGDQGEVSVTYGEKNSLYALMRAFQRLADVLDQYEGRAHEFSRSKRQIPKWATVDSLQAFPFLHTVPYLDVLPNCRSSIKDSLKEISRRLVAAEVNEARNEWLHGRRTPSNLDRLREGLEAIREAIILLQDRGFTLRKFTLVRTEIDQYQRKTYLLSDQDGATISFYRPSGWGWLGLPSLNVPQAVITSARFAEPTEVLRFTVETTSPYSDMWSSYPMRLPSTKRGLSSIGRPHTAGD